MYNPICNAPSLAMLLHPHRLRSKLSKNSIHLHPSKTLNLYPYLLCSFPSDSHSRSESQSPQSQSHTSSVSSSPEWTEEIVYLDESSEVICSGRGVRLMDPGRGAHILAGGLCRPLARALMIESLVKAGKLDAGFKLWEEMKGSGFRPNFGLYTLMVESLVRSGRLEVASSIFTDMEKAGFLPTPSTYACLIEMHCAAGQVGPAMKLYNLMVNAGLRPGLSTFISLLGALANKKLVDLAAKVILGEDLPVTLYNSLLSALASDGLVDVARKVFEKMIVREIVLTNISFGVFVAKVCELEGLDKSLVLLEENKPKNSGTNRSVIAVLIMYRLCRAGKIDDAWHALGEMKLRACKPDFIAYRIVSEGFRLAGRVDEAESILKQKRKFGVAPIGKDYREFILSAISERLIREAKELGESIVGGDFPIDDDVLNALIGSVSSVYPDAAIFFCKYMIHKDRFPSLTVLSNMSRSLCKNEKSNEIWDVFRDLMEKGYFTSVGQYNLMVSFLCKAGRVREAYDVLKEMKKNGHGPDIFSYNYLMEACCREDLLRPAKKLWDEMFVNGCSANLQTYNILICKLSNTGEATEAKKLFSHMLEKGLLPDNVTYTSLIKVLCRQNRIDEAVMVFYKSVEQDLAFGASTLSTLIRFLCKEGNYVAASGVIQGLHSDFEHMDSHIILLEALINAGFHEMALNHIKWVKNNDNLKLQAILTELMASLSTTPNMAPLLQLLQLMQSRGLAQDVAPWINLLESHVI